MAEPGHLSSSAASPAVCAVLHDTFGASLLSQKTTMSGKPFRRVFAATDRHDQTHHAWPHRRQRSLVLNRLPTASSSLHCAAHQIQCQMCQTQYTERVMADKLRFLAAVSRASAETLSRKSLPADASFKISVGFLTDTTDFLCTAASSEAEFHVAAADARGPPQKKETYCRAQTTLRTRATSLQHVSACSRCTASVGQWSDCECRLSCL